jgi:hypothetical protein
LSAASPLEAAITRTRRCANKRLMHCSKQHL